MFDIRLEDGTPVMAHLLSLTPFRRIVKDYFMICDSYYQAIRTRRRTRSKRSTWAGAACTTKVRSIAEERLKGKVSVDFDTARRLFTLICVLHWKG